MGRELRYGPSLSPIWEDFEVPCARPWKRAPSRGLRISHLEGIKRIRRSGRCTTHLNITAMVCSHPHTALPRPGGLVGRVTPVPYPLGASLSPHDPSLVGGTWVCPPLGACVTLVPYPVTPIPK